MRLIELLWESFVEDPSALPVTDEQRVELRRRLEAHECDPNSAQPWSQVRSELERE
jgi:putative addiction module component (TIGR02574 family)